MDIDFFKFQSTGDICIFDLKIGDSEILVKGKNYFKLSTGAELSCQIDNGNPVCNLETCAILYDGTNQSGLSEILNIGEQKDACNAMTLTDKSESVYVTRGCKLTLYQDGPAGTGTSHMFTNNNGINDAPENDDFGLLNFSNVASSFICSCKPIEIVIEFIEVPPDKLVWSDDGSGADRQVSFWTITKDKIDDFSGYKLLGDSICSGRTACQNLLMVKDISNQQNVLRKVLL